LLGVWWIVGGGLRLRWVFDEVGEFIRGRGREFSMGLSLDGEGKVVRFWVCRGVEREGRMVCEASFSVSIST